MLPIHSIWREYFDNHHEGLGSTYERFILHNYFQQIKEQYDISSVVDVPSFGMTGVSGINSLWWSQHDTRVTVVDHDLERLALIEDVWIKFNFQASFIYNSNGYISLPFEDNSFDLGWNFAALWFIADLEKGLNELCRISKKAIFLCIPNTSNIFVKIRSVSRKDEKLLNEENIDSVRVLEAMEENRWKLVESGYLDIPPWPDIAMKKEDFFEKLGLKWLIKQKDTGGENCLTILDYFSGEKPKMEQDILHYSFLENSPAILQKIWAHHQYFLFTPE